MNIILVSNSMAKAKTLSVVQVVALVLALILLPLFTALLFIVPQERSEKQGIHALIPTRLNFSFNDRQKHLDAYAVQLGEMQARMMRLDAQSDRLAKLAGIKSGDKKKAEEPRNQEARGRSGGQTRSNQEPKLIAPNRGGPLVLEAPLSEAELQGKIAELIQQIEFKADYLSDLEATLLQQSVIKGALPNRSPVGVAYSSSSFGWRIDPFNGYKAFHEGLDFTAAVGTPIYAAASGIVSSAEQTPDYGKIVKIDHGSGLETRYAHASILLVKVGERVAKGQKIAEVGNTGRSTGPHLHYEIRLDGSPLDPRKYLNASR